MTPAPDPPAPPPRSPGSPGPPNAPAPKPPRLSHAVFKTFDGLEVDVEGYDSGKGGKHYIDLVARGSGKKADSQAARINARVRGWQYRIPGYRYREIFQALSGLLAPLPHAHRKR